MRVAFEHDWRTGETGRIFAIPGDGHDVDSIDDGTAFLLIPRNFDRVLAVNRSTNDVMWTLGAQDDNDVLHGQHYPALLDTDPVTVLVDDSNNHRVVEYRRVTGDEAGTDLDDDGDGWVRTWTFTALGAGGLNWPRDVHRLPNGNTLVANVPFGDGIQWDVSRDGSVTAPAARDPPAGCPERSAAAQATLAIRSWTASSVAFPASTTW